MGQARAVLFLKPLGSVSSFFLFHVGVGLQAWGRSHLLSDLAQPQFPFKDGLSHHEEEGEEEDSSFKLCVPGIVTFQSPLHKTFRSTDPVGKCDAPTSPPNMPQAHGV